MANLWKTCFISSYSCSKIIHDNTAEPYSVYTPMSNFSVCLTMMALDNI